MENPATWTRAERIVNKVIRRHAMEIQKPPDEQVIGLSLVRQITDALRRECFLRDDDEAAHVFYSDPENRRITGPGRKRGAAPDA